MDTDFTGTLENYKCSVIPAKAG
ncbi:MAG: hypothetical protein QG656_161, partial [Candidatus Hydrogenedentes bacterium]|nr:hypothetical protein [Candidatus Hydrogenedentota bacterium]